MEAQQTILDFSRRLGDRGASLALDKAESECTDFAARAEAAILAKLATGPASGEDCTDYVRDCGVPFKDGRALGAIYASLRKRGLIRVVGTCNRRNGHGTAGGLIWARCFTYEEQKAAWLSAHPEATGEQIESACQAIAERLGV